MFKFSPCQFINLLLFILLQNMAIYQKAFDIIERYFGSEDGEDDQNIAPTINEAAEEFTFSAQVKEGFGF